MQRQTFYSMFHGDSFAQPFTQPQVKFVFQICSHKTYKKIYNMYGLVAFILFYFNFYKK